MLISESLGRSKIGVGSITVLIVEGKKRGKILFLSQSQGGGKFQICKP